MEIKTYCVEGFIDWQCQIPVGRARATIHFSGGAMTAYGVTPATYSTGDPVKQKIIENSEFYKKGRIKLLRKTGEPDPVKPRVPKTKVTTEPVQSEVPAPKAEDNAAEAASCFVAPVDEEVSVDEEEVTAEVEPLAEEVAKTVLMEIAVSCLTDAQNYLRDNFGIPTSKSRSKEKAQAFARENGIVFTGLN